MFRMKINRFAAVVDGMILGTYSTEEKCLDYCRMHNELVHGTQCIVVELSGNDSAELIPI